MPNNIIRATLIADYTDRTAADVRTANPGVFATDGDVPLFLYTSLKTLLGAADSTALGKRITAKYGKGDTVKEAGIEIQASYMDSKYGTILPTNYPGAEYARVQILFRLPTPVTTAGKTRDLELRTRWLLDQHLRGNRGISQNLTVTSDKTLSDSYFRMNWEKVIGVPDEIECVAEYECAFVRMFGN